MDITFIGIGRVGSALASRLATLGHKVSIAAHRPRSETVMAAQRRDPRLAVKPTMEAVDEAHMIFLATPFDAVKEAIENAGTLSGKIVVDCTNPIAPGLRHGLQSRLSGGEFVQKLAPAAKVVKAFTIYGYENFADSSYPRYAEVKPAMLIAGEDQGAKNTVATLCEALGWEPVDVGGISMSLHLEHMTLLWIKMARLQGRGAGFVWAMLQR